MRQSLFTLLHIYHTANALLFYLFVHRLRFELLDFPHEFVDLEFLLPFERFFKMSFLLPKLKRPPKDNIKRREKIF